VQEGTRLSSGARKLVHACAGVKPGEKVLVVTDTGRSLQVADAVCQASLEAGADPVKMVMQPGTHPGAEVSDMVAAAMKEADVIFGLTTSSLYHTRARLEACAAGSRLIAVTELTEETLSTGGIEADFEAQRPVVQDLARKVSRAQQVRLTTPGGTDLHALTGGRAACEFTGMAHEKGQATGVPDIEVALAPLEGTTRGTVVVDASATYLGLVRFPIRIVLLDGRAVEITGGEEAEQLRDLIERQEDSNCWNVAEIAVGLNPCSRVTGRIIEDEGTLGTCHVALGNNLTLGGRNRARLHIDLVMWRPTLFADGVPIFTAEPSRAGPDFR